MPNSAVQAEVGVPACGAAPLATPVSTVANLRVGGLTRLTTIDFPGRLAAVVFCQGCPWRCSYCHNPELLQANAPTAWDWPQVLAFLETRQGLLDGVVFSGGEPTLQAALPEALQAVRALGFATALHTGGMYPERLATVLPLLDWVGLDIKAPWAHYETVTATPGSAQPVQASLRSLLHSGIGYECRTTWSPHLFSASALRTLAHDLASQGVSHWSLQACHKPNMPRCAISPEDLAHFSNLFEHFCVRGD